MLPWLIVLGVVVLALLIALAVLNNRFLRYQTKFETYQATHPMTVQEHEGIVKAATERSVRQSKSTKQGQDAEVFAPWIAGFDYKPSETFHLGGTIDLIVFDGLDDGELRDIVFVEVKTGNGVLSDRQKIVREAVEDKRVKFKTIRIGRAADGSPPTSKTVPRRRPVEIGRVIDIPAPIRSKLTEADLEPEPES